MKAFLVIFAAVAGLLAAPSAAARPHTVAPSELLEVFGTYRLSNGEVLRVDSANAGTRARAQLRGAGPGEGASFVLVPVGPLEFVAREGRLRLRFTPLPFATEVVVEGLGASGVQGELGK